MRKPFRVLLVSVFTLVSLLANGGCSDGCESEANKQFAIIKKSIYSSLQNEWIASYNESSGCDSSSDPWVVVKLVDGAQSIVGISAYMAKDHWRVLSGRDVPSYAEDGAIAMEKRVEGRRVVAMLTDNSHGKIVEFLVESE